MASANTSNKSKNPREQNPVETEEKRERVEAASTKLPWHLQRTKSQDHELLFSCSFTHFSGFFFSLNLTCLLRFPFNQTLTEATTSQNKQQQLPSRVKAKREQKNK